MITHVKLDFMATAATLIRTHANYVKTCGGVGASVWYMRVVPAWETTGCWKPATTNGCQHQTCVMGHGVTQCPQTQGTVEQLTKAVFLHHQIISPCDYRPLLLTYSTEPVGWRVSIQHGCSANTSLTSCVCVDNVSPHIHIQQTGEKENE